MSNFDLAAIGAGAVAIYCTMMGVTWAILPDDWTELDDPRLILSVAACLLWPMAILMICGARMGARARLRRVDIPTATAREVER